MADKPVVTWFLIAVNAVVWLGMTISGGSENTEVLLDFGAMFSPLIANGEYWRLFTAMFLHVGALHLIANALGLLIIGALVERLFGGARYLTIYLVAGLFGSVLSYNLNTISVGAGASGALFGIMGAFAAYFAAQRKTFGSVAYRNLTGILVLGAINLFYGVATPGIDNWAHLGGAIGGFLLGLALAPRYEIDSSLFGLPVGLKDTNLIVSRWWVLPAAAVVLIAGVWYGTSTTPETPFTHLYVAERYFAQEDYGDALNELDQALAFDDQMAEAYLLRGKVFIEMGDYPRAQADLAQAIKFSQAMGFRQLGNEAARLFVQIRARNNS